MTAAKDASIVDEENISDSSSNEAKDVTPKDGEKTETPRDTWDNPVTSKPVSDNDPSYKSPRSWSPDPKTKDNRKE